MHNIKPYGVDSIKKEEKGQQEKEMEVAIPFLSKLGMVERFRVGEWEAGWKEGPLREEKMFVGRKAREMGLAE
jgi:hypothetical protein